MAPAVVGASQQQWQAKQQCLCMGYSAARSSKVFWLGLYACVWRTRNVLLSLEGKLRVNTAATATPQHHAHEHKTVEKSNRDQMPEVAESSKHQQLTIMLPLFSATDCRPGAYSDCSSGICQCLPCPRGFYCSGGANSNIIVSSSSVQAAGAAVQSNQQPAQATPCGEGLTTRLNQPARVRNNCGKQGSV
jgi:hypothetical protein